MTTAWVLQGGGSLGAAQVGMARALMESGNHPDLVLGTSAGALNAAWLATDPTLEGLGSLGKLWTAARRRDVFPLSGWTALGGVIGLRDHTVSSAAFARWLRSVALVRRLQDGVLPLGVVATDLLTGEAVLLDSGPTVPALLASAAMPGIFPPVLIGTRWLVDGSIASDAPIGQAVRAGADRVFVLPSALNGPAERPRSALGIMLRSSSIMIVRDNARQVAKWSKSCELFVLPAPAVPGASPFSFGKAGELIDAAHLLVATWLQTAQPVDASQQPHATGTPTIGLASH